MGNPRPLEQRCQLLRSLHVPGAPLVLPNAWDAASARAVVAAGFPVVATTSDGVAATLGYEDEEGAPAEEMLAAAARIARSVDVPVTIDAEAGYGLPPGDLVDALLRVGAAGCNLEDTDHATGRLVDVDGQANRLAEVLAAAADRGYGLVVNARVDVFLSERGARADRELLDEAVTRGRAYRASGADCVYPIFLSDPDAIAVFVGAVEAPVNILAGPQTPPTARLAELGVSRVSYGSSIHHGVMEELGARLADIPR
jgi:2-methylisocitrate lyase-like PEP mutase family enzyme